MATFAVVLSQIMRRWGWGGIRPTPVTGRLGRSPDNLQESDQTRGINETLLYANYIKVHKMLSVLAMFRNIPHFFVEGCLPPQRLAAMPMLRTGRQAGFSPDAFGRIRMRMRQKTDTHIA